MESGPLDWLLQFSDEEVITVMIDGGEKLCDYAIECWWSDKYKLGHAINQVHIKRWKLIKSRIRELGRLLKEAIHESSTTVR